MSYTWFHSSFVGASSYGICNNCNFLCLNCCRFLYKINNCWQSQMWKCQCWHLHRFRKLVTPKVCLPSPIWTWCTLSVKCELYVILSMPGVHLTWLNFISVWSFQCFHLSQILWRTSHTRLYLWEHNLYYQASMTYICQCLVIIWPSYFWLNIICWHICEHLCAYVNVYICT